MQNSQLIISYLNLRRAIGLLGLSLPLVLWVGGFLFDQATQSSISHYYYSSMRDIFVGWLTAIAVFLLAYRGYESIDYWCGKIAGLSGLAVAFFPTVASYDICLAEPASDYDKLASIIHYVSAAVFFLSLMFFCFFLFTKSKAGELPTPMKLRRNQIYRICGSVILICIALVGLQAFLTEPSCTIPSAFPTIFTLEAIAVWAFGLSWLIKGEAILVDQQR